MANDLLQSGLAWLGDQLQAHASREVVYRRGSVSVTLRATVGQTLLKLTDEFGGVRMVWTDRDYILRAADLAAGGISHPPQRGDRVLETVGGITHAYEVAAPANEPHWKWQDGNRDVLRVHTVDVGEV